METPRTRSFDAGAYAWRGDVDYREHPEAYRVGKGEQGVLICEPYKAEILPHWRFRTPEVALASSEAIYALFLAYLGADDFVGADLARKFLQMGFTRARRYANYKGGKKYDAGDRVLDRGTGDPTKILAAAHFKAAWDRAEAHPKYARLKGQWKTRFG